MSTNPIYDKSLGDLLDAIANFNPFAAKAQLVESDAVSSTNLPEEPLRSHNHYSQTSVTVSAHPAPVNYDVETFASNVDYVPRHEPHQCTPLLLTENVVTIGTPGLSSRGNVPGTVERSASTQIRGLGVPFGDASGVMTEQIYLNDSASVSAIFGRVVSAYEMLQAGWVPNGAPIGAFDIRFTDKAGYRAASATFGSHVPLYVPEMFEPSEMAALVSLMVEGGPGAYNWHLGGGGAANHNHDFMPAGARYFWPGGARRMLLVTERPGFDVVAYGGAALSRNSVAAVVNRMTDRFSVRAFEAALKLAAVVNRVHAPPIPLGTATNNTTVRIAKPSRLFQVANWDNGLHRPNDVNRTVRDAPNEMDNGPDSTTPYARPCVVNDDDASAVAAALSGFVRPQGAPAGARIDLVDYRSTNAGFFIRTQTQMGANNQIVQSERIYPWNFANPEQLPNADVAAFSILWRRVVSVHRYQIVQRAIMDDNTVAGDYNAPRNVYGLIDKACHVRLPGFNLDGWYAVLIGASVLAVNTHISLAIDAQTELENVFDKFAADVHLNFYRVMYDSAMNTTDFRTGVNGAAIIKSMPAGYMQPLIPDVINFRSHPFGSFECLEPTSMIGGSNATAYMGYGVPGGWDVDVDNRTAKVSSADAKGSRRALDAAARLVMDLGTRVKLSGNSDRPIHAIRMQVTNRAGQMANNTRAPVNPFFLPATLLADGDIEPTHVRMNEGYAPMIFTSGSNNQHGFMMVGHSF